MCIYIYIYIHIHTHTCICYILLYDMLYWTVYYNIISHFVIVCYILYARSRRDLLVRRASVCLCRARTPRSPRRERASFARRVASSQRARFPEGTKRATSVNVQLPCLQKDLRAGSILRDILNFSSQLCRRRSGIFTPVARLVPPEDASSRDPADRDGIQDLHHIPHNNDATNNHTNQ